MEYQHQRQKYTCPMHPEIVQDKPGNCPKCGMSLVPVKVEPDKASSDHQHADANNVKDHTGHEHLKMNKDNKNKGGQKF